MPYLTDNGVFNHNKETGKLSDNNPGIKGKNHEAANANLVNAQQRRMNMVAHASQDATIKHQSSWHNEERKVNEASNLNIEDASEVSPGISSTPRNYQVLGRSLDLTKIDVVDEQHPGRRISNTASPMREEELARSSLGQQRSVVDRAQTFNLITPHAQKKSDSVVCAFFTQVNIFNQDSKSKSSDHHAEAKKQMEGGQAINMGNIGSFGTPPHVNQKRNDYDYDNFEACMTSRNQPNVNRPENNMKCDDQLEGQKKKRPVRRSNSKKLF